MWLCIPLNQIYKSWELFLNPHTLFVLGVYYCTFTITGARGDVVVKALRHKPAGRGFDSR